VKKSTIEPNVSKRETKRQVLLSSKGYTSILLNVGLTDNYASVECI